QGNSTPSKSEIQQVVTALADARARGDWTAYAEGFADEATMIKPNGVLLSGRSEIVKDSQASGLGGPGTRVTVQSVFAISANALLVDVTTESTAIVGGGRPGKIAFIFMKQGSSWKIAAVRSVATPA